MDKWLIRTTKPLKENEKDTLQTSTTTSVTQTDVYVTRNNETAETEKAINTFAAGTSCGKKRKYQETYLEYGFSSVIINGEQRPQCVICYEVLANESMKPAKLKRHIATKHEQYQDKPLEFFKRKGNELNSQKSLSDNIIYDSKLLRASFEVSYLIAKEKKPYTIGETLIKPAAIKMCEIVLGENFYQKLKIIPLSNDTVAKRISEINTDLFIQLLDRIQKSSKFAIQLDETTDVTNFAQLILYVRYYFEKRVVEDLLFCQPLEEKTTGEDIYKKINDFFIAHKLNWSNCVGVCTDGAAAMTGKNKGLLALIKNFNNALHIKYTHCMIHREALASKKLSPNLDKVLRDAVSVINFIKNRALNSRLFAKLCQNSNSQYDKLINHTEVRWLSKGKSLRRLFDLSEEVRIFLIMENPSMADFFQNDDWLCTLAYLTDIFEKLNDLNKNLQGKGCDNILFAYDKILGFTKKLELWKHKLNNGNIDMFPCFCDFIEKKELNLTPFKNIILSHLSGLENNFEKYYSNDWDITKYDWIRNPFNNNISLESFTLQEQEQFTEIICDRNLKLMFQEKDISEFWLSIQNEYPTISNSAMNILLPFASTYLCEAGFSALLYIKSKYRTRLTTVENDLRISLSQIVPRFDELCKKKQQQKSH